MRKQVTTDKATQCLTISRNLCGPSSKTDSGACLGSSVPKDVADTTTKFVFTNFPVLHRNTNTTCSTNHDSGTTASPHCILFARQPDDASVFTSPNKDQTQTCDRNCSTSFRNTHHKHCTEPWRNDISNFFPIARSSHMVLVSSAASKPQSHGAFWAVASCSVPRS